MRCFRAWFEVAFIVFLELTPGAATTADTLAYSQGATAFSNSTGVAVLPNPTNRLRRLNSNDKDVKALQQQLDDLHGLLESLGSNDDDGKDQMIDGALATVEGFTETLGKCTQSQCDTVELLTHGVTLAGTVASAAAIGGPAGPVLLAVGSILAMLFGGEAPTGGVLQPSITRNGIKDAVTEALSDFAASEIIQIKFPSTMAGDLTDSILYLSGVVNTLQQTSGSEGKKRAYLDGVLAILEGSVLGKISDVRDVMNRAYAVAVGVNTEGEKDVSLLGRLQRKTTFSEQCHDMCPSALEGIEDNFQDFAFWNNPKPKSIEWDSTCFSHAQESQKLLAQMFKVLEGYRELALMVFSSEVLLDLIYNLAGWDDLSQKGRTGKDAERARGAMDLFKIQLRTVRERYDRIQEPGKVGRSAQDIIVAGKEIYWEWWQPKGLLNYMKHHCALPAREISCDCGGEENFKKMLEGKCKCDYGYDIIFVPPNCGTKYSNVCGKKSNGRDATEEDGAINFGETNHPGSNCKSTMRNTRLKTDVHVGGTCELPCSPFSLRGPAALFGTTICGRRKACPDDTCRHLIQAVKWV